MTENRMPEEGRRRYRHAVRRIKNNGRFILLVGGLGLIAWAGYELSIRMDDFSAWLSGVRHLSEVRGQPFLENLWIMMEDPKMSAMVQRMGFLALSVLIGLLCALFCNKRGMSIPFLLLSVGMLVWGLSQGILTGGISGTIVLLLLLSIFAGAILNRASGRI